MSLSADEKQCRGACPSSEYGVELLVGIHGDEWFLVLVEPDFPKQSHNLFYCKLGHHVLVVHRFADQGVLLELHFHQLFIGRVLYYEASNPGFRSLADTKDAAEGYIDEPLFII